MNISKNLASKTIKKKNRFSLVQSLEYIQGSSYLKSTLKDDSKKHEQGLFLLDFSSVPDAWTVPGGEEDEVSAKEKKERRKKMKKVSLAYLSPPFILSIKLIK